MKVEANRAEMRSQASVTQCQEKDHEESEEQDGEEEAKNEQLRRQLRAPQQEEMRKWQEKEEKTICVECVKGRKQGKGPGHMQHNVAPYKGQVAHILRPQRCKRNGSSPNGRVRRVERRKSLTASQDRIISFERVVLGNERDEWANMEDDGPRRTERTARGRFAVPG